MTHTVTVTRNMRGELEATNELPIPAKPGYVLVVTTGKGNRGTISTFVQAMKVEADTGTGFVGRSFVMFGDFNKRLPSVTGRATEKAIAAAHAAALEQADALVAEAEAFYAKKDAPQDKPATRWADAPATTVEG